MKELSVIVPVYNEEKTVAYVVKRLKKALKNIDAEIIVVDDGSTDGTWMVLNRFKSEVVLLRHERNKGKGSAVRTALEYAKGEYTVIQDADLEYNPEEIPQLLKFAKENSFQVVYGSRFLAGKIKGNLMFYFGNRFLTFVTNLLFRSSITDMETCYKLVKTSVLKELDLRSERFEIEPEITAKLLNRGIEIKEIPISYSPRKVGEKKIKIRDGFSALKTLFSVWWENR